AAALLVVLIAPALFHREQKPLIPARSPASPEALPAYLLEERTATANKEPGAKVAPAHPASANETRAEEKQKENAQPIDAAAERDFVFPQPQAEAKREGGLADRPNAPAIAAQAAPPPPQKFRRQTAAAPGGEAGAAAVPDEQRVSVRLVIN